MLTSCSRHREETLPLFGTGDLSLADPEAPAEAKEEEKEEKKHYGSLEESSVASKRSAATRSTQGATVDPLLNTRPHVPGQNPCLWLFHLLQGIGIVNSICLLATQILPLVLARSDIIAKFGILALALKAYIALLCLLFALTESDLKIPFIRDSPLLQRFWSRGFLYSFLGLICVEEANSEHIRDIIQSSSSAALRVGWASVFMEISSWSMLGVGVIYMLLGLCCCKRFRDRLKDKEVEDWREYRKALKEWKELHG